ncbi:MAG: peptidyl-prolyl cis-trans isomerase, partial [Flavobacteriia bacterium]|nr:peptidyl-prolyl cis-trans isomerase [Flavobacteriia bacterium]
MKYIIKYTLFLIFTLGASCSQWSPQQDDVVARVGTLYLYRSDIEKALPQFSTSQDSTMKTRAFIDQWARKQIIVQQAKFNLPETKILGIEELVDQYRIELYANT